MLKRRSKLLPGVPLSSCTVVVTVFAVSQRNTLILNSAKGHTILTILSHRFADTIIRTVLLLSDLIELELST